MKAPAFKYYRASSLEDAVTVLADQSVFKKLLAGGQSLCPMMNFRLVRPDLVVDISRLRELHGVEQTNKTVRIGAGVTHAMIEDGIVEGKTGLYLREVAGGIAYRAVRNRGTVGGSLAHADPSADWPSALTAMGARLEVRGPNGSRTVDINKFLEGPFQTSLNDDEVLFAIELPRLTESARWAYVKACQKPGEFAKAIAVTLVDEKLDLHKTVLGARQSSPACLDEIWDGKEESKIDAFLGSSKSYERTTHFAALRKAIAEVQI